MADVKLSDNTIATDITVNDYFVTVRHNGGSSYTDQQTPQALVGSLAASLQRKVITVSVGGSTLTDDFFGVAITEMVTNKSNYIINVDFTQDVPSKTIEWVSGDVFVTGQVIIAKL